MLAISLEAKGLSNSDKLVDHLEKAKTKPIKKEDLEKLLIETFPEIYTLDLITNSLKQASE